MLSAELVGSVSEGLWGIGHEGKLRLCEVPSLFACQPALAI